MLLALVPVKQLEAAKSRLAGRLSTGERAGLCLAMLEDVLNALAQSGVVDRIAVISRDAQVLAVAERTGQIALRDEAADLNGALRQGMAFARQQGADAALIVPGDVPMTTPAEVRSLVGALPPGRAAVACPTRDGGTAALLLRPPDALAPAYGPGSFRRHLALAESQGIPITTCLLPNLALDVDEPADLPALLAHPQVTLSAVFLGAVRPGSGSLPEGSLAPGLEEDGADVSGVRGRCGRLPVRPWSARCGTPEPGHRGGQYR